MIKKGAASGRAGRIVLAYLYGLRLLRCTIVNANIRILPQPDDVTCGPTSLQAVYRHYGLDIDLPDLIQQVRYLEDGGTLAVLLGIDALQRNFQAKIVTFNLRIFDPTWAGLDSPALIEKLREQLRHKPGRKLHEATRAYVRFLELGGRMELFPNLRPELLNELLRDDRPVVTGLSVTYLYNSPREFTDEDNRSVYNDVSGDPTGHFVVLCGYDTTSDEVMIADPYKENPISRDHFYMVDAHRLIHSILLGVLTYDSNLLVIEPVA